MQLNYKDRRGCETYPPYLGCVGTPLLRIERDAAEGGGEWKKGG